jgi:hypothetical protein
MIKSAFLTFHLKTNLPDWKGLSVNHYKVTQSDIPGKSTTPGYLTITNQGNGKARLDVDGAGGYVATGFAVNINAVDLSDHYTTFTTPLIPKELVSFTHTSPYTDVSQYDDACKSPYSKIPKGDSARDFLTYLTPQAPTLSLVDTWVSEGATYEAHGPGTAFSCMRANPSYSS